MSRPPQFIRDIADRCTAGLPEKYREQCGSMLIEKWQGGPFAVFPVDQDLGDGQKAVCRWEKTSTPRGVLWCASIEIVISRQGACGYAP